MKFLFFCTDKGKFTGKGTAFAKVKQRQEKVAFAKARLC